MAINRAPFNALVDDSGTGTTGTPWNKAAIAGVILDPVDAALAALPAPTPPVPVWANSGYNNNSYYALAPMVWTVAPADLLSSWYWMAGNVLTWGVNISTSSTSGSPGVALYILIPGGKVPVVPFRAHGRIYTPAKGWVDADIQYAGVVGAGPAISISFFDGSAYDIVADTVYVNFTIQIPY